MKKILCLIVLLAGVTMFTSCGKDDATYTAIPKLDVSKAEVLFESNGGTGSITINTSSPVTATTESTWLTVSANGNVVTATAPVNGSLDGRSATIIIKAGDAQAIVTATQKGSVYGINGGLEYELSDTAQAKVSIPVVQSAGVSVTSLADWLTASFNSETSTIEVVATSNDVEEPRIGYVAFQTGNVKDTLEIAQAGLLLNLEKLSIAVPNEGGVESVTIEHSRPVTIESAPEWVECAFNDKTGVLTLSVDENKSMARQGTVTLKSLAAVRTITVNQAAATTEETEEPVENPYYGTYTFYFQYGEDTNNMGNFSIVEYVGEDAEEGDVLIIDLYLPGSAIFGVLDPEGGKLYIPAYQDLGYDEYPGLGTIGNLTYSASGEDMIVFDITEQGIVSSDFCVLATNQEYTQAYGLVIPSGGTSWFIKAEEAAARGMYRAAAAKNRFKIQSNKNLPKGFKLFSK